MKTRERRGGPRVEVEEDIKVTVLSMPEAPAIENRTFDCRTRDISARGIRFVVSEPLPRGCPIELRLAGTESLSGFWHIGRITWSRQDQSGDGYSVGVHFTETPEATLEAWEELLEEKLSRKAAS
jgi:hypothetical protein